MEGNEISGFLDDCSSSQNFMILFIYIITVCKVVTLDYKVIFCSYKVVTFDYRVISCSYKVVTLDCKVISCSCKVVILVCKVVTATALNKSRLDSYNSRLDSFVQTTGLEKTEVAKGVSSHRKKASTSRFHK
jgi:hypothetical protein